MFESAELGQTIDDATFAKEVPQLRADLLDAQYDLLDKKRFAVVILVNGVDGAGKGETVNLLNEWMDPRYIQSQAFVEPTQDEAQRPPMWRFWQALPPKGRIGVLFGSWYTMPILRRVRRQSTKGALTFEIERIRRFEKMLHDEGVLLLKFWFHLSRKVQKKRLETLSANRRTRWRVTAQDWANFAHYDRFARVSERVLRETSSGEAPWLVVEGADANYRSLTVGRAVLEAMRSRLAQPEPPPTPQDAAASALVRVVDTSGILRSLPFKERMSKERYATEIEKAQRRLNALSRDPGFQKRSAIVVFEGMDAAGKGGAIRRVTQALAARYYRGIPIAAPTEEERAQPYLWRFWRHMPILGRFLLFDRSWYGRVLVERVEGFCSAGAWTRAYSELNDFEEQLDEHGYTVVKLWLAISKDEQLRRFKERQKTRFKRFKITKEDWRNRDKWDAYEDAASDMIDRTSTSFSPWTVIEANDKHLARVRVVQTICQRIAGALSRKR